MVVGGSGVVVRMMHQEGKKIYGIIIEARTMEDSSAVVPYTFRWRHGGSKASLAGSFNAWDAATPMEFVNGYFGEI